MAELARFYGIVVWLIRRLIVALHEHRISSVRPLDGFQIECNFVDGSTRLFDFAGFAERYPFYRPILDDLTVFQGVTIILGGDAIAWDDMRDISSEGIYLGTV